MRKIQMFLMVVVLVGATFLLSGCSDASSVSNSSGNEEQNHTEMNQQGLIKQQPAPTLTWSLERDNLIKRTNLWNDPNKISYIYLTSYGKVMSFYTIKGKVSSVNSQLTNTDQLTWRCVKPDGTYSNDPYCNSVQAREVNGVISSPAEDGSYGTNGNAVFFFTTEGAYVEWNGEYMLADQPLKMATQPELVRAIQ